MNFGYSNSYRVVFICGQLELVIDSLVGESLTMLTRFAKSCVELGISWSVFLEYAIRERHECETT